MKKSEMILVIASELVHEFTNYMDFDDAQSMDEIILDKVEKWGMLPPTIQGVYNTLLTPPTQTPSGTLEYSFHRGWEAEEK